MKKKLFLIFLMFSLVLMIGCAPTMKDFVKLQNSATSPDENQRFKAVEEMGKIKKADPIIVVPTLSNILKSDKSTKVRIEAARSLTQLGFLESKEALIDSLQSDESSEVRVMCAEGVCTLLGNTAQNEMIQCVQKDKAGTVRASCVKCLGKMNSNEANTTVQNSLQNDEDSLVRMAAASALGQMKDKSTLGLLINAAENDSAVKVKEAAVVAIGAIPGQESMDFLVKALKDSALMDSAVTAINNNKRGNESPEVVNILVRYVDQTPSAMDDRICNILLQSGSPQIKQAFRKYYNLPNASDDIIEMSVKKMRRSGDTSLVSYLIKDLKRSNDFKVQVNLIRALAYFQDRSATPILLNMLRNRSRYHSCIPKHLMWALGGGGLNDPRAYNDLCNMCCNKSDKKLSRDACVASSDIYRSNYKVKLPECPCWNK